MADIVTNYNNFWERNLTGGGIARLCLIFTIFMIFSFSHTAPFIPLLELQKFIGVISVSTDSQKVLNVPRILKSTLIMFLNIEVQKSYLNGLNLRK